MLKIKNFIRIILFASSLSVLFGASSMTQAASTKNLNIAVLICCGMESGWDSTFVHAMDRMVAAKPHGLNITYTLTDPIYGDDVVDAMTLFAESGEYDIIFNHTGMPNVSKVNGDYPDIAFVSSGSGNTGGTGNHYWIYKRVHEAAYAMGVMAGHLTENGKLGVVGTFPADDVNDEINAYFAGARSVRPDIKQTVSFIESWYDPGKAAEMTSAQIATGADIIFSLANNFTACEDAGILCFGNFADESPYSPTTIVSSAMAVWDPDIKRIIDAWWDFKENGKPHSGTPVLKFASMAEGGSKMAPLNPAIMDRIPEDVRKAVEKTVADIKSGDLVVELDVSVPKSN